jgi:hypothetical protein
MTSAGVAIDEVAQRVRDPEHLAHSRDFVREMLTHSERFVNTAIAAVTTEFDLQLYPYQQIYGRWMWNYPFVGRPTCINQGGREIPEVDWQRMHHFDGQWFRRTGTEAQLWGQVGRDAIFVHPGLTEPAVVRCTATVIPPPLSVDDDLRTVPDIYLPIVYDLVECLLLAKQRNLDDRFTTVYSRLVGRLSQYVEGGRPVTRRPDQQQSGGLSHG